ncbi:hypothetical protein TNCV_4966291, partial [Trichonephila clavipes]
ETAQLGNMNKKQLNRRKQLNSAAGTNNSTLISRNETTQLNRRREQLSSVVSERQSNSTLHCRRLDSLRTK